jgi:hypothetical protein
LPFITPQHPFVVRIRFRPEDGKVGEFLREAERIDKEGSNSGVARVFPVNGGEANLPLSRGGRPPPIKPEIIYDAPSLIGKTSDFPILVNRQMVGERLSTGVKKNFGLLGGITTVARIYQIRVVASEVGISPQSLRQHVIDAEGRLAIRIPPFSLQAVNTLEGKLVAQPLFILFIPTIPVWAVLPHVRCLLVSKHHLSSVTPGGFFGRLESRFELIQLVLVERRPRILGVKVVKVLRLKLVEFSHFRTG